MYSKPQSDVSDAACVPETQAPSSCEMQLTRYKTVYAIIQKTGVLMVHIF